MAQRLNQVDYDVVVLGGGAAGVAAAVASSRNGARTLLVEAGPMLGGEMLSGLPIDGCISTRGEWVVGGVSREIFEEAQRLGGYVGHFYDWRTIWVVCVDPEIMKIAVMNVVRRANVDLLLYTFAEDVVVQNGTVTSIVVLNKNQRTLVRAKTFIDASGDGDLAVMAGAQYEKGAKDGTEFQPVSLVFRMAGVDVGRLMNFVAEHPENVAVAENPYYADIPRDEQVRRLVDQGFPKVFFVANGPLIQGAIADGLLHETALIGIGPVSMARREIYCNTTRIANVDATRTDQLSKALPDLMDQVWTSAGFLRAAVPGFEEAVYSGIAPRVGIRETRRIIGDEVLTAEDVLTARKRDDGVAKGCHHIDIHGSGRDQLRQPIPNGGSYDIPFGALVAKGLENVMMAGRCFSASREAHGSARVMGTCMAMGQAVGTAAALTSSTQAGSLRDLPIGDLRARLKEQGAVLDGTY
ncbi:FAD-dependent oxidoreductase [Devosia ginsengisoli]|uniref:FAD-dependent oxidoreductase n=1 Tax=Devosia ginsengisoli TaxID=400770 RepID=A0A5B8LWH2_9HYPH|nr:FAD-dependent oxidoreductase [Devosia ginsengisoli]QDZ12748.1 FAD-dependent oxidoreductase [Devosia ginsengisoli]